MQDINIIVFTAQHLFLVEQRVVIYNFSKCVVKMHAYNNINCVFNTGKYYRTRILMLD